MANGKPREKKPESKLDTPATDVAFWVIVLLAAFVLLGQFIEAPTAWLERMAEYFANFQRESGGSTMNALIIFFSVVNAGLLALVVIIQKKRGEITQPELSSHTPEKAISPKKIIREQWTHIQELAQSNSPSDWNMAILRADALLDEALMMMGYEGLTIADRLKIVDSTRLPSLDRVWSAHRLRNIIAHEPLEQHSKDSITQALRSYEQAFRDLGMMEKQTPAESPI